MRSPLQTRKHLNYCLSKKQRKWPKEKKILSWKNFQMSCKISTTRQSIIIQIKWTSPAPAPQLSDHHLQMIYGLSLKIRTFCYKSLLITSLKESTQEKCMFKLKLHWLTISNKLLLSSMIFQKSKNLSLPHIRWGLCFSLQ
jgi:hypothetical protein